MDRSTIALIVLNLVVLVVTAIASGNANAATTWITCPEVYTCLDIMLYCLSDIWQVLLLLVIPFISLLFVWFLCPYHTELE